MGLTYVTVKLRPLAGSKREIEESFLVDTGAVDCLVAESKLRKLGIKPEGKDVYELADGTTVELPFGFARLTFMVAQQLFPAVGSVEPPAVRQAWAQVGIQV